MFLRVFINMFWHAAKFTRTYLFRVCFSSAIASSTRLLNCSTGVTLHLGRLITCSCLDPDISETVVIASLLTNKPATTDSQLPLKPPHPSPTSKSSIPNSLLELLTVYMFNLSPFTDPGVMKTRLIVVKYFWLFVFPASMLCF